MNNTGLVIEHLCKDFDGIKALDSFCCSVGNGEVIGIVGPNGAGKTTLFNVITGLLRANGGQASFRGVDLLHQAPHKITQLGIARTFQDVRLIRRITVLENLLLALKDQPGEQFFNIFFRWTKSTKKEAENQMVALSILEKVGLSQIKDIQAGNLSYGQQKLLGLACCMATGADLLLLDEPVAGIAPQMVEKVQTIMETVTKHGKSIILIEHNLDVVNKICDRLIFMDAGMKVCEGTPEEVLGDLRVIRAYIG